MLKSLFGVTESVSVAALLVGFGSRIPLGTFRLAVLTRFPVASLERLALSLNTRLELAGKFTISDKLPEPLTAPQLAPALAAQVQVAADKVFGKGSSTPTPSASEGPALLRVMVYSMLVPGTTLLRLSVLAILKSLLETRLTVSLAVSLARLISPPPDTVALLTRLASAVWAMLATKVMSEKLEFAASASVVVRLQVTVWAAMLHVQPAPTTLCGVNPSGKVSVTVIAPKLAAKPTFKTLRV